MSWPAPLLPVVAEFGERCVWDAGTKALGYPPIWAEYTGEQAKVCAAILSDALQRTN
jgi:hypothetical protein